MARIDLIAVASFGGHFEQLLELAPAWAEKSCLYVTTRSDTVGGLNSKELAVIEDCHHGQVAKATRCFFQLAALFVKCRPKTLLTTGALPGLLACLAGRAFGARVIWIDSLANAEELSKSGKLARKLAHHHFTQWPEVARDTGSEYAGSLL